MLRWIELGVIALLTLVVLLTVVRPLMKQMMTPDPPPPESEGGQGQLAGPQGPGMPQLPPAIRT